MAGTKTGGIKARDKNLKKNPNFYREIGRLGGLKSDKPKGFALNRELARKAGAKGGSVSRRTSKKGKVESDGKDK
jgi:general stress protein YciG